MSKYTTTTKLTIEFEGDSIEVKLSRLKRADYLKLTPYIKVDDATGKPKMSFEDNIQFMECAAGFLPKYVKQFDGLRDAEGDALSFKDIIQEVYFLDIVSQLVDELFAKANLKDPTPDDTDTDTNDDEDEIKNFEGLDEDAL